MSRDGDQHSLSSVHVHIDTKYPTTGTPSLCTVRLPRVDHKYQFVVQDATLDFTFYNIRSGRNKVTFNEYISTDLVNPYNIVTMTINEGSYNVLELVDIFNDAFSKVVPGSTPPAVVTAAKYTLSDSFKYSGTGNHLMTYDANTGKISYKTNQAANYLEMTPGVNPIGVTSLLTMLGFTNYPKTNNVITTGFQVADMYPHPYIYVMSDALTKYGSRSQVLFSEGFTRNHFDEVICKIPLMNHSFGDRIYFQDNRSFQFDPELENVDIDLRVTHQNGDIVNLNGGSLKLTLSFYGTNIPYTN